MDHQMSSHPNSEDECAETEPGGFKISSDMDVEEAADKSSGDSHSAGCTGVVVRESSAGKPTEALKERRQGRVTGVVGSADEPSSLKLTLNNLEGPRRRTVSEGDALFGGGPQRKPSVLTPDAPEFVPRWLKASDAATVEPPATAPVNTEAFVASSKVPARSRSMVAGFPQPPPPHNFQMIPPHSNPLPGFGRPPLAPFGAGLRMHAFPFSGRHPADRRISAPAMPYVNHRYPGAVPLYHAVEPLTPIPDTQSHHPKLRHSSGGDAPLLGRGPSPIAIPLGSKRTRNESITDYLPFEPPLFYSPGFPRQAGLGGIFNNRQKLRSVSTPPNHVIGSPPSGISPLSSLNPSGPGKPQLQYSREFLLQQRYSPLSWTTPAFVPQSEGGRARRTSSTTDPREPDAAKGTPLPELACIKRKDELSYDYSVGPRRWESTSYGKKRNLEEQNKGKGAPRAFRFTFVSYNILAQNCLEDNKDLYETSPPEVLEWEHRKHNLLKEIMHFKADVFCLQEVNHKHYEEFFKPNMELQGFKSVYKRRTGEKQDGCAVFFHADKFELKKTLPVEFNRGIDVLDRDNVALLVMLQPKKEWTGGPETRLVVATTHLLFNPKRGDIKLAQLAVFLAELDRFTRKGVEPGTGMPLYHPSVVCGDFNAVPYSDIYRLIHRGRLKYENLVAKDISGQHDEDGHGLMRFVAKPLLPKPIGITEQCQYADIATRYVRTRSDTSMTLNSVSDVEELMAHAAKAVHESSRKSLTSPVRVPRRSTESGVTIDSVNENCVQPDTVPDVFSDDEAPDSGVGNMDVDDDVHAKDQTSLNGKADDNDNIPLEVEPKSPTTPTVTFPGEKDRTRHESSSSVCSGPLMPVPLGELNHAFRLLSVYKHVEERRGRNLKEVTTHHEKDQSTVDYIFFTVKAMKTECKKGRIIPKNIHEGPLKLMGRYRLLNEEDSANMGTLPNTVYSSDHFALAAKFILDPN